MLHNNRGMEVSDKERHPIYVENTELVLPRTPTIMAQFSVVAFSNG